MKSFLRKIPLARELYHATKRGLAMRRFRREFQDFQLRLEQAERQGIPRRFTLQWSDRWPCLGDAKEAISFEPHYTYHPAWAARVLAKTRPHHHVDIGSTLPFITMISAFIPTDYYEWRPPNLKLSGLRCDHADLLSLPFEDASIDSLSCMHTIEHVGIGRYGDPIDVHGDLKAISELKRVLAINGNLLFVVPMGGEAEILYNAQRTYSYEVALEPFADLDLVEFALILEDASGMVYNDEARKRVSSQKQGCGCFWFNKSQIPHSPIASHSSDNSDRSRRSP